MGPPPSPNLPEGPPVTATDRALELTRVAADAAVDKLGTDLIAYDVSEQLAITDV